MGAPDFSHLWCRSDAAFCRCFQQQQPKQSGSLCTGHRYCIFLCGLYCLPNCCRSRNAGREFSKYIDIPQSNQRNSFQVDLAVMFGFCCCPNRHDALWSLFSAGNWNESSHGVFPFCPSHSVDQQSLSVWAASAFCNSLWLECWNQPGCHWKFIVSSSSNRVGYWNLVYHSLRIWCSFFGKRNCLALPYSGSWSNRNSIWNWFLHRCFLCYNGNSNSMVFKI